MREIRHVQIVRYITPLREGGSLPAIAEADDGFLYVIKFRGAGHGVKALVAEYIGSELARLLGFKVPELVWGSLDEAFGRSEGDEEIQDLLKNSQGLNIGLHYLSGAVNFDPLVFVPDKALASSVIWLDAMLNNIDRSFRNTNMLVWNKEVWLIDHGASLYFHHSWSDWKKAAESTFPYVKDHVLLPLLDAEEIRKFDQFAKSILSEEVLRDLVYAMPDTLLQYTDIDLNENEIREVYISYFLHRLNRTDLFINEAIYAKECL